jgi:hypothetical protein
MPGMKKKATPSPKPKNTGPILVLPNGSTVGLRDLGKVKPTPKSTATPKPKVTSNPTWQQQQKKAEAELLKRRQTDAKRTGSWPNGYTN